MNESEQRDTHPISAGGLMESIVCSMYQVGYVYIVGTPPIRLSGGSAFRIVSGVVCEACG